jgi:hypothetical protein
MKEDTMTDEEIGSLAKKYVDDSLADGGGSPSSDAYGAAVAKVEAETRKLLTASEQRNDADREAVAC